MQLYLFTICLMPIYSYNKNFGKKLFFLIMIGVEVYGILIGIDFDYEVMANLFAPPPDNGYNLKKLFIKIRILLY